MSPSQRPRQSSAKGTFAFIAALDENKPLNYSTNTSSSLSPHTSQPKSSKNSSLTPRNERVLTHLAAIKARAPKNKCKSQ